MHEQRHRAITLDLAARAIRRLHVVPMGDHVLPPEFDGLSPAISMISELP